MGIRKRLAIVLFAAPLAASAGTARADPLPTDDFQVDLYQGPLLSPIRVMSLGGAYAGFGEDIAGMVSNSAAPAVREAHAFRHIELDLSGSFSIPLDLFENNDFDNSGDLDEDSSSFVYATGGVMLQIGHFGVGLLADALTYRLTNADGEETAIVVGRQRALVAANMVAGQLAVGGGLRLVSAGFDPVGKDIFYAGVAPEFGLLVRPSSIPFRFGASYRLPVVAAPVADPPGRIGGLPAAGGLVLPRRFVQPWELELGMAVQVGPRPLNVPFHDVEDQDDAKEEAVAKARKERATARRERVRREADPAARAELERWLDEREAALVAQEDAWLAREEEWLRGRQDDRFADLPRQRLLLLLSMVISGPVARGVSLERFFAQGTEGESVTGVIGGAGASVNFSPRFGVEAEPIENRLVVRAGSYYEPNRFGDVGRQHFTFGSHLKLFTTDLFGLLPELAYGVEAGLDLAPRYQSLSGSITVFR